MKRWSCRQRERIEMPRIDAFIADLVAICEKHGLSIAHEDTHGSFVIEPLSDSLVWWLQNAAAGEEVLP